MTRVKLDLFSLDGEQPRSAKAVIRRLVLWSIVCWISGAPSFAWAVLTGRSQPPRAEPFDPWAMALGIVLFSIGYTVLTSTDRFDIFQRRRGVRLTLYIGYFTRLAVSILFPLGMGVDLLPGIASTGAITILYESLGFDLGGRAPANLFFFTLLTTCVQGFLLNIMISLYMLVVYAIVRLTRHGRPEPRGFEVIPIANQDMPEAQIRKL